MFKKSQENLITHIKSESECESNLKNTLKRKYSLLNVIGPLNVKRWNKLKYALSFNTDEHFATKLLDIAEEHFNRNNLQENASCNARETSKKSFKKASNINSNIVQENINENFSTVNKTCTNDNCSLDNIDSPESKNSEKHTQEYIISKTDLNKTLKNVGKDDKVGRKISLTRETKEEEFSEDEISDPNTKCSQLSDIENKTSIINANKSKVKVCQHFCTNHPEELCPINYPHYIVNDVIDYASWLEKDKMNHQIRNNNETEKDLEDEHRNIFSVISLPDCLCLGETNTNHGLGVFVKNEIKAFTQFGPLVGKMVKEVDIPEDFNMRDLWEINTEKGNLYINTENEKHSNWLRYIRPAPKRDDKNLAVISKDDKLHFVSLKVIKSGEELLYWQECPISTTKKKMEKTTCGGCNMVFSHPHYYRIHCSVFHDLRYSLTIRKYHCKVCGAAVLGKENIMKHAAELHNGQGAYQCQFCKKFFLRLNYLEMHRTYGCSANPRRSRPLCDFCGKKFCQPQKLKVHIKRMHSDFSEVLKEFQCKSCLKILGSRAALQRHAKEVHQKQIEGACSCSKCGKRFQNNSNLKIHMLTHSGIKPFKCKTKSCSAAFTTKQCLQFHYKKVHNFTEENMPKIERSIDYTFQAYSGFHEDQQENNDTEEKLRMNQSSVADSDSDNESDKSESVDDPEAMPSKFNESDEISVPNAANHISSLNNTIEHIPSVNTTIKVLSKGSKKWIGDDPLPTKKPEDMYIVPNSIKDELPNISLHDTEIYERPKLNTISDFTRHEASNASLLVEAALDSVCSVPNIDIDVSTNTNCSDSLVNNLYTLTQPEHLPDVSYADTTCINETKDINLISPSVTDHVSVTDELNDELQESQNRMDYSNFNQDDFSASNSPEEPRSNFVRSYISNIPTHNSTYEHKTVTPSPPRYDFGHAVNINHLSSDESDGMAAQNLSLQNSKNNIQIDLSIYKTSYKPDHNYIRRMKFDNGIDQLHQNNPLSQNDISSNMPPGTDHKEIAENHEQSKYRDDLSMENRSKFEIELERLKCYEGIDNDFLKQRSTLHENELDFRSKGYDLMDTLENRKQYETVDSDFRSDRNFEPLILNSSEQGLDMSARSFHNYSNINRYHHLYPEVDRVDLRLNYSPPPPTYTHDILRVVSLDLTPPGRHSVDLSLRSHSQHQITNTRLLSEHGLQANPHRLLDQSRLLSNDINSTRHLANESRLISEASSRILSEHSTVRLLSNDDLTSNHILNPDQTRHITDESRLISEQSRLLEQSRLIGDGRILPPTTPSGAVSPVQVFSGYSVTQTPYHPTPIAPRPHVSSPTPTPYHHYPSYF